MIYATAPTPRTKRGMTLEHELTTAANPDRRAADAMDRQAPVALIGLLAIAVIVAINYVARPHFESDSRLLNAPACKQCGTVVAVRRSAHSVPVTFVEVQMRDGSLRTVRGPGNGFSVGDVVEVKGEALTLRDVF